MPRYADDSERVRETTAARGNEQMSADFEYCAHCGAKLPKNEWCPTVAGRDSEGTLRVHAFCDEDCKAAWVDNAENDET